MRTQSIRLFSRVVALRQAATKTGTASTEAAVSNGAKTTTTTAATSSSSSSPSSPSAQNTSGNSFKSFKEYRENAKTYGPLSASLAEQRHLTDRSER